MNKKRQEIEKTIYDVMNILDKSGHNAKFYKDFFGKMSDAEFDSYMKSFLADDRENFYLEVEPFTDKEPKIEDIKKAADYLGVPLTEYMWMPFANPNGEALRTKTLVPVGLM